MISDLKATIPNDKLQKKLKLYYTKNTTYINLSKYAVENNC